MESRRKFVQQMMVGSAAVFAPPLWAKGDLALGYQRPEDHPIRKHFPDFTRMSPGAKIAHIERVTSAARAHPSNILVCMPKVTPAAIRQVRVADFDGMDQFSDNFGLKFESITDFFDNENSITTSGSHLAAQSIRYAASGDQAALTAARRAFASLRKIFEFGVEQGLPGFMGKPYHFKYSTHTTGDQYLHTLWGLWSFHEVASKQERGEIKEMIVAIADHQIAVDFTQYYKDGRSWNMREDTTDYNAIMAALVAAAYKMTGEQKYLDSFEFVMEGSRWLTHRRLDGIIAEIKAGTWEIPPWEVLVGESKRPGEFAHWEQIQHCQFTAIAASIIRECVPDQFSQQQLSDVVGFWWEDHVVGFDREYWGYLYWFLVSADDRSWRSFPRTERVPRDQWFGGHPMLSFSSPWIYGDCLARFQWTAMVVARHCPPKRAEAVAFARETLERLQPHHLLWISDPDGKQIPPELRYFTEFLSSEVPECIIASYWEGRRLNLWS